MHGIIPDRQLKRLSHASYRQCDTSVAKLISGPPCSRWYIVSALVGVLVELSTGTNSGIGTGPESYDQISPPYSLPRYIYDTYPSNAPSKINRHNGFNRSPRQELDTHGGGG